MPAKISKKLTLLITCLLSISLLTGCIRQTQTVQTNQSFTEFTTQLFQQEVSSNTISLHYTLKDPSSYGILDFPITYGSYEINVSENIAALENCQAVLNQFDYNRLSEDNQVTYDVLDSYLNTAKESSYYALYEEPLNPTTGIQAQLPILLSEYQFHSAADVETYLALLATTDEYFQSLIEFEQLKSKAGLFMSEPCVDAVITQCDSFIATDSNTYLGTTFEERLNALEDLTEEQRQAYLEQNQNCINSHIIPAYQSLADHLRQMRGTGKNDMGLCHLPDGKEYYELLVKRQTGSSRSIEDLQKLTKGQVLDDLQSIQTILQKEPALETAGQAVTLEENNPSLILDDLEAKIQKNFPDSPEVTTRIKYVPEDMQEYLSPAFYMIPAIDNTTENVIYINQGNTVEGLNLYTTLAHEGYPGHLYQNVYYANENPDPIRTILSFGGYSEGWATYAEMCSYYLAPIEKDLATLMQKNNSILLGLYAYADMGIHHNGWELMDLVSFFYDYGITDMEALKSIYQLILSNPGNYLKYYIGYVEFLELKKTAIETWGDEFNQERFHKEVLEIGPAPFDVITKHCFGKPAK